MCVKRFVLLFFLFVGDNSKVLYLYVLVIITCLHGVDPCNFCPLVFKILHCVPLCFFFFAQCPPLFFFKWTNISFSVCYAVSFWITCGDIQAVLMYVLVFLVFGRFFVKMFRGFFVYIFGAKLRVTLV